MNSTLKAELSEHQGKLSELFESWVKVYRSPRGHHIPMNNSWEIWIDDKYAVKLHHSEKKRLLCLDIVTSVSRLKNIVHGLARRPTYNQRRRAGDIVGSSTHRAI